MKANIKQNSEQIHTHLEIYVWISIHYHEDPLQLVPELGAAVSNPEGTVKN